jgi:hypothetical protein
MDLTFGNKNKIKITIIPYVQEINDESPDDLGKAVPRPSPNHLFAESQKIILTEKQEIKGIPSYYCQDEMGSPSKSSRSIDIIVITHL